MKKGTNSRAYDLDGVRTLFTSGEKALKVEHPDGPPSWYWYEREPNEYLFHRDGETYRDTVTEDAILNVANHPDNLWEAVSVETSPFDPDQE